MNESKQKKLEELARQEERRQEMLQNFQKKKDCEKRAHAIVERLLEGNESVDWIRRSMIYLMPGHYDDVVEERSIISKCGYPLCSETLKNVPKQQFKISTKRNEVLDITERKKFTSNQCFKRSTYLRQQISSTPLWLRTDKDNSLEIKILNEDVDDADLNGAGIPCVIKSNLDVDTENAATVPKIPEKEKITVAEPKKKKEIVKPKRKLPPKTKSDFDFNEMTTLLNAWWTSTSKNHILNIAPDENSYREEQSLFQNNTEIYKPKIDDELRESAAKINAFLNGETEISLDKIEIKEKDVGDSETTYLPLIDKKAQVTLRRKVLYENLKRGFSTISGVADIKWELVSFQIKNLIGTFHLDAKNVVLEQKASVMACIMILHLISRKNNCITIQLEKEDYQIFEETVLTRMGGSKSKLNELIEVILK